jgi:hypothetical protein
MTLCLARTALVDRRKFVVIKESRQQVIANTPVKRSDCQIRSPVTFFVLLVFKDQFVSLIPTSQNRPSTYQLHKSTTENSSAAARILLHPTLAAASFRTPISSHSHSSPPYPSRSYFLSSEGHHIYNLTFVPFMRSFPVCGLEMLYW